MTTSDRVSQPPPSAGAIEARISQPPAGPVEVVTPRRVHERRVFGFLALGALAAIVRLAMPVGMGLFLGALLAFTLEPIYARLRMPHGNRKGMRPGVAALTCALGATLVISWTVVGLTTLLITRGVSLLGDLKEELEPDGKLRQTAEAMASRLDTLHIDVSQVTRRLQEEAVSLGSRAATIAAEIAGATFTGLLTLFFMTLAAYFVLRHWTEIVTRLELMVPLERRHTHALLEQFRVVGREVLLGTVVTGLVQGLFAAVGYWVTGVPEPAFFGALTAIASLVPGVGTLLVWVTIGIVQIVSGHAGAGLVELVYSALTIGVLSDYVIRPRLVGREKGVPAILTFVALFGGVEVFGIVGLVLGPIIVTLSFAILKGYAQEVTPARPSDPPPAPL
ncbi:MAG TPA: AI-2E family transporter [Polyangiaceae bacterium]|jgi:predicted PurR-regulated permease PerM|nr:AI-2E family transporter [Polyangiaceae bacterium]